MSEIQTSIELQQKPDPKPERQNHKDAIIHKTQKEISAVILKETEKKHIFGNVFEIIAQQEELQKRKETPVQRQIRELVEAMYQDAESYIGTSHERPRKPDAISISFDKNGQLVIDEIIEIKSSIHAIQGGIDKGQPQGSLDTVGKIVTMLNKVISGEAISNLPPEDTSLSNQKRLDRYTKLSDVKRKIETLNVQERKITFSQNLIYRFIVPSNINTDQISPNLLLDLGYAVTVTTSKSEFSQSDLHEIIKSRETPSKNPSPPLQ